MDITSWGVLLTAIVAIVTIANTILDIVSNKEKMIAIQRIFRVVAMILLFSLSLIGLVLAVLSAESLGLWYPLLISFYVSSLVFNVLLYIIRHYIKQHQKIHEDNLKLIEKIIELHRDPS